MPVHLLGERRSGMHKEKLGRYLGVGIVLLIIGAGGGGGGLGRILGILVLLDAQIVHVRSHVVRYGDHTLVGRVPFQAGDGGAMARKSRQRLGRVPVLKGAQIPHAERAVVPPRRQQIRHVPVPRQDVHVAAVVRMNLSGYHGSAGTSDVVHLDVSSAFGRGEDGGLRRAPLQILDGGMIEVGAIVGRSLAGSVQVTHGEGGIAPIPGGGGGRRRGG
mmetsp:Transcript_16760/g.48245  ORF Transcript_16760/g.48245 Transcript_16760/m.48245 type:complete len:217 (-) Transcript_16760:527-1177(-)